MRCDVRRALAGGRREQSIKCQANVSRSSSTGARSELPSASPAASCSMPPTSASRKWTGGCFAAPAPSSASSRRSTRRSGSITAVNGGSPSRGESRATSVVHQSPEFIVTAYTPHIEEVRAVRSTRERVASLLRRYPDIYDKDRRENFLFLLV